MSPPTARLARRVNEALVAWGRGETGDDPEIIESAIHRPGEYPTGYQFEMRVIDVGMGHYSEEEYLVLVVERRKSKP